MVHTALLLAALASVPAHYLVFEIDRHDAVTLVAAEEVEAVVPESVDAFSQTDDIEVEVRDAAGQAMHRESIHVDRYLRAEFEGVEPRWIERERTPFVVRVPRGGETIEIRAPRSRSVSQFSVRALPRGAAAASAAGARAKSDAGNPANRLDLL